MNIQNKNILITGASDGIGKSMALGLSAAGAHVILLGRSEEKLAQVSGLCEHDSEIMVCDITDTELLNEKLSDLLLKKEIDVLINNAGVWHKAGDLTTLSSDEIDSVIATNLTSHIKITHKLLPHMRNRETAIINVISKAGAVAQKGLSAYSASKYGMRGFTDVLREDTKDEPIRIAAVYQAGTRTSMFEKSGQELSVEHFTEPDDLAEVVKFMLTQPPKIWLKEVHVEF